MFATQKYMVWKVRNFWWKLETLKPNSHNSRVSKRLLKYLIGQMNLMNSVCAIESQSPCICQSMLAFSCGNVNTVHSGGELAVTNHELIEVDSNLTCQIGLWYKFFHRNIFRRGRDAENVARAIVKQFSYCVAHSTCTNLSQSENQNIKFNILCTIKRRTRCWLSRWMFFIVISFFPLHIELPHRFDATINFFDYFFDSWNRNFGSISMSEMRCLNHFVSHNTSYVVPQLFNMGHFGEIKFKISAYVMMIPI